VRQPTRTTPSAASAGSACTSEDGRRGDHMPLPPAVGVWVETGEAPGDGATPVRAPPAPQGTRTRVVAAAARARGGAPISQQMSTRTGQRRKQHSTLWLGTQRRARLHLGRACVQPWPHLGCLCWQAEYWCGAAGAAGAAALGRPPSRPRHRHQSFHRRRHRQHHCRRGRRCHHQRYHLHSRCRRRQRAAPAPAQRPAEERRGAALPPLAAGGAP
jgi:hypothetical protein